MSAIERLKAALNSQPDSWLSVMVAKADVDELIAEVERLSAIVDSIPEGCTPADAKVLREANHALIDEVARLNSLCESLNDTARHNFEVAVEIGEKMQSEKRHKEIAEGALLSVQAENDALRSRVAELESQLPEGMKHCTIQFKECEKGHGWLTASNWVQHECATCERNKLRADAVRDATDWLAANYPRLAIPVCGLLTHKANQIEAGK